MGSLVFVHGIGVRAPAGKDPYETRSGDDLGAKLAGGGNSFPKRTGQLAVVAQPEDPAALWDLLLDDPSFELRALAAMLIEMPTAAVTGPPGQAPPWVVLQQRLNGGLVPAGQLAVKLKTFELEAPFAAAVKEVQADPAAKNAIRHPQDDADLA
jgi:hypothetical protein